MRWLPLQSEGMKEVLKTLWDAKLGYENQMLHTPDIFPCIGGKVLDFSIRSALSNWSQL